VSAEQVLRYLQNRRGAWVRRTAIVRATGLSDGDVPSAVNALSHSHGALTAGWPGQEEYKLP